ncbi:MAG: aminotransferase class I/II-fold pyridoxal phosphate-dependent enzyme [Spirochaetales bacterium]|nr:MAG: aminotransferase class I/II-fold pyridoxal phosphate-dependent enzyme [Spirochaetales bacterium]
MKDIFEKCGTDEGNFGKLRAMGDGYYTLPVLDSKPGHRMTFKGKEKVMWSINNYLGLAENEEVRKVAVEAAGLYSTSSPMGSRMMSGNTTEHHKLEADLADYSQKEAAILFNYGYLGVLGTISSLCGPEDILVMDKLAHASIVDGVFLSRSPFRVFRHNDMDSLETILKRENRDRKGGILIVVEGAYGMTGDLAKLKEVCDLKDKYNARLFIDDAHGIGVMGSEGRGTADHFGVQDRVDIYFGTFAKAFASIGGFSAASKPVVDWIRYNARTQVFAKSLPLIYVKTLQKTLELVRSGDDRRKKMWENSKKLKEGIQDLGYFIGDGESPLCAVYAFSGDEEVNLVAMKMIKYLREKDIFVSGVAYPVIPLGLCMFRMIPTPSHTDEDIERTIKAFKEMREDMNLSKDVPEEIKKNIKKVYGK